MLLHLMLTQGFDEEGMKNREKERKTERERKMPTRQLEHSQSQTVNFLKCASDEERYEKRKTCLNGYKERNQFSLVFSPRMFDILMFTFHLQNLSRMTIRAN